MSWEELMSRGREVTDFRVHLEPGEFTVQPIGLLDMGAYEPGYALKIYAKIEQNQRGPHITFDHAEWVKKDGSA